MSESMLSRIASLATSGQIGTSLPAQKPCPISTVDVLKTSRGTTTLRWSEGAEWTAEELIGMQLSSVMA
jgi:hypothetical protein